MGKISRAVARQQAGERVGILTLVEEAPRTRPDRPRWRCRCDCGVVVNRDARQLTSGRSSNCGCLRAQRDIDERKAEREADQARVGAIAEGVEFLVSHEGGNRWRVTNPELAGYTCVVVAADRARADKVAAKLSSAWRKRYDCNKVRGEAWRSFGGTGDWKHMGGGAGVSE